MTNGTSALGRLQTSLWGRVEERANDSGPAQEQRFVSIGANVFGQLRVVVYTYRGEGVRVISVRKPDRKEIRAYEEGI
jgi:hypothetical protein